MASNQIGEMKENELLFVYGSNISERRMKLRGVQFLSRERALVRGFRLAFSVLWRDGFACTTILPDDGSIVHGVLCAFPPKYSFKTLDHGLVTEGKFERTKIEVETKNGDVVKAQVYLARKEHVEDGQTPSTTYLDVMLEAEDLLPKEYVAYLRSLKSEN